MKSLLSLLVASLAFCTFAKDQIVVEKFACPPQDAKPWCYWWWQNGHADEKSITADLEAMAKLGFGGVLISDSRGYWDDEDHVVVPKPEIEVMSPEWRKLVQFAIREARRLDLKVSFNTATSGGKLCGPWKVGADAPKRLMCRVYPSGATLDTPDFPYWKDVAAFEVKAPADKVKALVERGWYEAGDGTKTQVACAANSAGIKSWIPVDAVVPCNQTTKQSKESNNSFLVRFISTTVPDHEYDVDVLDADAIRAHFNRFTGAIMDEAGPELVGTNSTIVGIYSVSWEGIVPMWYKNFPADFKKYVGYEFSDALPVLAGFAPRGTDPAKVITDCRRARNRMFCDNFYGTLRDLAAERKCIMFSENGGPWHRDPEIFQEADQLNFYALNDMPQGEFWQDEQGSSTRQFADNDLVDRFFTRGAVSAGHVYGKKRISLESFTHMRRHWSMSPSVLRTPIDKAFADGGNFVVWHTYSLSPEKFGVPGCEYFAGTHINGNVTWHNEAKGFLDYLGRCQYLLSLGEPVVDIAIMSGRASYADWGRLRNFAEGAAIPAGYNYDLVNDDEWKRSKLVGDRRVMASGMSYAAKLPAIPDLAGNVDGFAHRRTDAEDIYFVQGEGKGVETLTFRVPSDRKARLFDAVTGAVTPLKTVAAANGCLSAQIDLSAGSAIVVFSKEGAVGAAAGASAVESVVAGPWNVSFEYHRLTHGRHLPAPRKMELMDWTESTDVDLKYFAGTATYTSTFRVEKVGDKTVSLGALPTGVAHVFVNGVDCGIVWCAPWSASVPAKVLKAGDNEIRIRYTNNWTNRLIGDCLLDPADRVTTSCLQYVKGGRRKANGKMLNVYSGYCSGDRLQPSGLMGPVRILSK